MRGLVDVEDLAFAHSGRRDFRVAGDFEASSGFGFSYGEDGSGGADLERRNAARG